jgi:hypothetical protein
LRKSAATIKPLLKSFTVPRRRAISGMRLRNLLAPVYGWFTEGFDTRDLKEAKALPDELAA